MSTRDEKIAVLAKKILDTVENEPADKQPKTFGKRDFTGYSKPTIVASISFLENHEGSLPGPLAIVRNALRSALEIVEETDPTTEAVINFVMAQENRT